MFVVVVVLFILISNKYTHSFVIQMSFCVRCKNRTLLFCIAVMFTFVLCLEQHFMKTQQ